MLVCSTWTRRYSCVLNNVLSSTRLLRKPCEQLLTCVTNFSLLQLCGVKLILGIISTLMLNEQTAAYLLQLKHQPRASRLVGPYVSKPLAATSVAEAHILDITTFQRFIKTLRRALSHKAIASAWIREREVSYENHEDSKSAERKTVGTRIMEVEIRQQIVSKPCFSSVRKFEIWVQMLHSLCTAVLYSYMTARVTGTRTDIAICRPKGSNHDVGRHVN